MVCIIKRNILYGWVSIAVVTSRVDLVDIFE